MRKTKPKEKGRGLSFLKQVKHLLGAGPYLLVMGIFFEFMTLIIGRWISISFFLSFRIQVILTILCLSLCLLGIMWFHRSLNLIKVNLLHGEKRLITNGPFCYVRHPLYATLLLTLPPLMIIWFSDILFIIPWILIILFSHFLVCLEERGLIIEFGEEYYKYRKFVPSLLPYKGAGGRRFRKHRKDSRDAV